MIIRNNSHIPQRRKENARMEKGNMSRDQLQEINKLMYHGTSENEDRSPEE